MFGNSIILVKEATVSGQYKHLNEGLSCHAYNENLSKQTPSHS